MRIEQKPHGMYSAKSHRCISLRESRIFRGAKGDNYFRAGPYLDFVDGVLVPLVPFVSLVPSCWMVAGRSFETAPSWILPPTRSVVKVILVGPTVTRTSLGPCLTVARGTEATFAPAAVSTWRK